MSTSEIAILMQGSITQILNLIFYAHSQCNENVQSINKFAPQTSR